MLPISPKQPVRFTPPGRDGEDAPPVYLIRPASLRERIAFRRALTAAGAQWITDEALLDGLRAGIREVASPAEAEALIAVVDGAEAVRASGADLSPDVLADVAEIEGVVRDASPRYSRMMADRAAWLSLAPLVAASMFLVGLDGERPLARRGGVIPDDVLEALPPDDLTAIGWRAVAILSTNRADEKNSA